MSSKEIKRYKGIAGVVIISLFAIVLLSHCAHPMSPQGGPKDTLPPAVVSRTPRLFATNSDGKRIQIVFDEYIQLKDQQKEFFTSPYMKYKPVVTVKGRSVIIDIKDTLLEDQTYVFDFGRSIVDNNEGNPLTGFYHVFSTGPAIDSMFLSAYTIDANKSDSIGNVFALFFDPLKDTLRMPDSTLFYGTPVAMARSMPNGIMLARHLKPIDYRIYAFEDTNGNQTYDPGTDRVAFVDSLINPALLPPFEVWHDTLRGYIQAYPQLLLRLFMDSRYVRQTFAGSGRPEQGKMQISFTAPHPEIKSLKFEGIDSSRIFTEYRSIRRDTIYYWIDQPQNLPDTIRSEMIYLKHDSIGILRPDTVKMRFTWKAPALSRREKRDQEELQTLAETVRENGTALNPELNPFKYSAEPSSVLNPERDIKFSFDYPLVKADTASFTLSRINGEQSSSIKFSFVQDTLRIREWRIKAPWNHSSEYRLSIPPGALVNTKGESNDSITLNLKTMNPSDFGTFTINVAGKTPESRYIIQLQNGSKQIIHEEPVTTGSYTFRYIAPGKLRIRIIEDNNGNGKWDGGSLVERIQPERSEFFSYNGREEFESAAGWTFNYDLDMNLIFAPVSMERMRRTLDTRQSQYEQWYFDQMLKRAAESHQRQGSSSGSGAGGVMGNARNMIR